MRTVRKAALRTGVAVVTALLLSGEASSLRAQTPHDSNTDHDDDAGTDDAAGRRVEDAHGHLRLHDARYGF